MQPVSAIVVFIIIWWTVIFCILPIGIKKDYTEGQDHENAAPGSPPRLDMKRKLLMTTWVSVVLWGVAIAIILSGVIDLQAIALSE